MTEATKTKKKSKFIPNLAQLQEAVDQLPDPEEWSNSTYISAVLRDGHEMPVPFKKRQVNRGSKQPYRWIYEGKVLIRKRDIQED